MKITEIRIAPQKTWEPLGGRNPLRAAVKLSSDNTTVECVLSDEAMKRMVALCADEIAKNAEARVREFCAAANAIEGDATSLLEGDTR